MGPFSSRLKSRALQMRDFHLSWARDLAINMKLVPLQHMCDVNVALNIAHTLDVSRVRSDGEWITFCVYEEFKRIEFEFHIGENSVCEIWELSLGCYLNLGRVSASFWRAKCSLYLAVGMEYVNLWENIFPTLWFLFAALFWEENIYSNVETSHLLTHRFSALLFYIHFLLLHGDMEFKYTWTLQSTVSCVFFISHVQKFLWVWRHLRSHFFQPSSELCLIHSAHIRPNKRAIGARAQRSPQFHNKVAERSNEASARDMKWTRQVSGSITTCTFIHNAMLN